VDAASPRARHMRQLRRGRGGRTGTTGGSSTAAFPLPMPAPPPPTRHPTAFLPVMFQHVLRCHHRPADTFVVKRTRPSVPLTHLGGRKEGQGGQKGGFWLLCAWFCLLLFLPTSCSNTPLWVSLKHPQFSCLPSGDSCCWDLAPWHLYLMTWACVFSMSFSHWTFSKRKLREEERGEDSLLRYQWMACSQDRRGLIAMPIPVGAALWNQAPAGGHLSPGGMAARTASPAWGSWRVLCITLLGQGSTISWHDRKDDAHRGGRCLALNAYT